nr:unnamed protein product [Callosobruchus analis]
MVLPPSSVKGESHRNSLRHTAVAGKHSNGCLGYRCTFDCFTLRINPGSIVTPGLTVFVYNSAHFV